VFDPTDNDNTIQIPIGKQTVRPRHIWYTPCSGIWQTVWLESAPSEHISDLVIHADMYGEGKVHFADSDSSTLIINSYHDSNE
jgi:hypothetical protein